MSDRAGLDVLIVSRLLEGGGAERQAKLLAENLAAEGRRVGVLAFRRAGPEQLDSTVQLLLPSDVDAPTRLVVRGRVLRGRFFRRLAPQAIRLAHGLWSAGAPAWVRNLADRVACRLALWTFASAGQVIGRAVKATEARTVIAFLPSMYCAATAGLWSSNTRLVASYRNDPTKLVVKPHWRQMQHLVARRADAFGANTAGAAGWIQEQYRPDRQAGPVLTPNILGQLPGAVVPSASRFIVIARLIGVKRVDLAIDAFSEIAASVPDWELLIAGDGPDRDDLSDRVGRRGLEGRCTLLGEVDVEPLLSAGGVLVHPSVMDGTPNAIMEAMAHGMPCIITDASPGPVELVVGSVGSETMMPGGLMIRAESTTELADAMLRLAQDAGMRERLAQAARLRAEKLTWDGQRASWLAIIDG